jgi:ferrous iron transport protein B
MSAPRHDSVREIVLALAGQPNVGKSTVFNLLTGLSQHVGNWPGKTVERREGTVAHGGVRLRIIDLPGTYGLSASSEEERIARDFILDERPDVIVMLANAAALERSLYLLTELLVLPVPVVLGLNMMDVAEDEGIEVEPRVLEAALRMPVVPLVARHAEGVPALLSAALRVARAPQEFAPARPEIGTPHRDVLTRVRDLLTGSLPPPLPPGWAALKLLEGDPEIAERVRQSLPAPAWKEIEGLLGEHEDAVLDVASGRYQWIGRMLRAGLKRPPLGQVSLTDRLDRVAVHPLWGMALLLAVFALMFGLTFGVGSPLQRWLDTGVVLPLRGAVRAALAGRPPWVSGLLADGVLGGAGLVLTFLPILVVFFAALALLEESGYLARAAYVTDSFMHVLGLHGRSFLPLFVGFGCNVPAVMGARVIPSRSGRLLTILLAPLVPCSARLAVLAFLVPVFFHRYALAVALLFVLANLVVLAAVGVALSHTVFRGQHAAFIMELPLYHVPDRRSVARFVWSNTWAFLRKAGGLILLLSALVWTLSYIPGAGVEDSLLARFAQDLAPLGRFLGLDWRLLVALLTSFVAKENAVATLGILYGAGAKGVGIAGTLATQVAPASALSFLAATMLFIPCAATVAVMRQETGDWRWTLFGVALLLAIALGAAGLVYQGSRLFGVGLAHA